MKTIAQKIQRSDYSSLDEMVKDLQLMCANAKTFNEPGSDIYRVSCLLNRSRFETLANYFKILCYSVKLDLLVSSCTSCAL